MKWLPPFARLKYKEDMEHKVVTSQVGTSLIRDSNAGRRRKYRDLLAKRLAPFLKAETQGEDTVCGDN